jgi:hypothetical protein
MLHKGMVSEYDIPAQHSPQYQGSQPILLETRYICNTFNVRSRFCHVLDTVHLGAFRIASGSDCVSLLLFCVYSEAQDGIWSA